MSSSRGQNVSSNSSISSSVGGGPSSVSFATTSGSTSSLASLKSKVSSTKRGVPMHISTTTSSSAPSSSSSSSSASIPAANGASHLDKDSHLHTGQKMTFKAAVLLTKAVGFLYKQQVVVKNIALSKFFQVWRMNATTITLQVRRLSLSSSLGNYLPAEFLLNSQLQQQQQQALAIQSLTGERVLRPPLNQFQQQQQQLLLQPHQQQLEASQDDPLLFADPLAASDGSGSVHLNESHRPSTLMINSHKQNYLTLFTENEKLREQYSELRKSITTKENQVRFHGGKTVMLVWLRSKYRTQIREYFDKWTTFATTTKLKLEMEHRELLLDIGKQQVDSYLSYLKETESVNTILKNNLFCTLYFLKWKTNACFVTLNEERKLFNQQKRAFLNELQIVKQSLALSNQQEAAIMSTALLRGTDVSNSLEHVRYALNKALKMHKSLNEQNKVKDSHSLSASSTSASASSSSSSGGVAVVGVTSNGSTPPHGSINNNSNNNSIAQKVKISSIATKL